jgi:predicted nucleic acid-binding protein
MTRFAIDAPTAIRLAKESITVSDEHQLVAPSLLRSEALSILYGQVREGVLDRREALEILDRITTMRIRLLGDRVSRATAWKIAEKLDWPDTRDAEYLAVAQLQADVFVTVDAEIAGRVDGVVPLAAWESLLR